MERQPKKYVCEKCGYLGDTSERELALRGQMERQAAALKLARDALENHQGNYVLSKKECQPINEALAAINEVLKGE